MLAIASSLDSLGVGVAYGLSGTRLRFSAHVCISVVMLVITWTAVLCGGQISRYLPPMATHLLGALFFVGIGIWILFPSLGKTWQQWTRRRADDTDRTPTLIAILNNPDLADRNVSRDIDVREALLLGVALSLNNIGGGISAGMIQIPATAMAFLSVFFNVVCLVGGDLVGRRLGGTRLSRYTQVLSGILMIGVGLWQLY